MNVSSQSNGQTPRIAMIKPSRRGQPCPLPSGDELGDINYGIAHQLQDLSDCFQLVYLAYRRAGLTLVNSHRMRLTPYHLLDTTEVFAARWNHQIVSTVTLAGDGSRGLPSESEFPDEIQSFRDQGFRMAEIGSLADRREAPRRFLKTLIQMMHLVTQVGKHRGYDGLVAAVHPRHANLYQRLLPFRQFGDEKTCSYANGNPAVLLAVPFEWEIGSEMYQRFFGQMRDKEELRYRPWEQEAKDYFATQLERQLNPPRVQMGEASAWAQMAPRSEPRSTGSALEY